MVSNDSVHHCREDTGEELRHGRGVEVYLLDLDKKAENVGRDQKYL